MSDILRAFPWLGRLRPLAPALPAAEPVLAALLLVAGSAGTAAQGFYPIAVLVVAAVALASARLVPVLSLSAAAVAGIALAVLGWANFAVGWALVMGALAIGLVAMRHRGALRWFSLGVAVTVGVALGSVYGTGLVVSSIPLLGAWALGVAIFEARSRMNAVQQTAVLTEQLDASQLELAVTAERERVAQEVHDVVAHSLAVILAQAEGARALSTKRPAAMTDALDRIAAQSRSALLDVRGIVDGLTGGAEPPQPTVDDLPELLRGVEEAGLAVRSTSAGERQELGLAQEASVYRIVQEGATNAIRHRGRGSALDVVLDWRGPGLSIQVVSSGTGDAVPAPGAGRGIPGMTDRARIAGGWLAAGEDESGDHRITAFVPFREQPAVTDVPVPA